MNYSSEYKDLFTKINHFFLEQNNENYNKTLEFIQLLGITRIELLPNNVLSIYLRRPGILIGKHGEFIKAFSTYLDKDIKVYEDMLIDYLTPCDYSKW